MPFKVERVGNESIIVLSILGSFGSGISDVNDYKAAVAQVGQIAAEITGPIYRITDATSAKIGFGDLVLALGEARIGEKGSVSDPRMKSVFVASNEMVRLAGESLKQAQYGHIEVTLCSSLDDAIAHARAELVAGQ